MEKFNFTNFTTDQLVKIHITWQSNLTWKGEINTVFLVKMPAVISSLGSVFLWVLQTWQVPGARKHTCFDVLPKDMVLTPQFDTNWTAKSSRYHLSSMEACYVFPLCTDWSMSNNKANKEQKCTFKTKSWVSDCIFYIAADGQCWSPSWALCTGSTWCSDQNTADRGCSWSMCFLKEGQGSGEKLCHQFN